MKKFEWKSVLALALTGVLALGLTACGSSDSKTADAGSAAAADGKIPALSRTWANGGISFPARSSKAFNGGVYALRYDRWRYYLLRGSLCGRRDGWSGRKY